MDESLPSKPTEPRYSDFDLTYEDYRKFKEKPLSGGTLCFGTGYILLMAMVPVSISFIIFPPLGVILSIGTLVLIIGVASSGNHSFPEEKLKSLKEYDVANDAYEKELSVYRERLGDYNRKRKDWWFSLSGRAFEFEFARLIKARGYDAHVTQASGDGGVDIRAEKDGQRIIIECKAWKDKVGVQILRGLNGVRALDEIGWVVGLSGFTKAAIEFAEEKSLKLYDYNDIAQWVEEKQGDS